MQRVSNQNSIPSHGKIDKNTYVQEVVLFIEQKLQLFPVFLKTSTVLQNLPNTIEGENAITENLCSFLTIHEKNYDYHFSKQDNYEFQFINQSAAKGHRSYDTSIILANIKGSLGKILTIEAKRLPTPGTYREKEYVAGNLGGIERFKKEVHAQEISCNLALMVGYIQKENGNHWQNKVNEWINEQIKESSNKNIAWQENDLLTFDKKFSFESKITKYTSTHSRITLPNIKLFHYWIDLN